MMRSQILHISSCVLPVVRSIITNVNELAGVRSATGHFADYSFLVK